MDFDLIKANGKTYKLKIGELIRFETDVSHYYFLDQEYLPGVSTILQEAQPTPYGLKIFWQQNTKEEADTIFETTGDFGTKMHDAYERLLLGEKLTLLTEYPTRKEKVALMAFKDWFSYYLPTEYQAEQPIASKELHYAGTLDFVGKFKNKRLVCCVAGEHEGNWLIDFKTSNAIHMVHELQVLAYQKAYEESFGVKIDHVGILRLGTIHKGKIEPKEGFMKTSGKGWEFKEVKDYTIDHFMKLYSVYKDILHGGEIPMPTEIAVFPETLALIEEVETK